MTERPASAETATCRAYTPVSAPEMQPVAFEGGSGGVRREIGDRPGVIGRRRRVATLVVLTLIVAVAGCRSGGKRKAPGSRPPRSTPPAGPRAKTERRQRRERRGPTASPVPSAPRD